MFQSISFIRTRHNSIQLWLIYFIYIDISLARKLQLFDGLKNFPSNLVSFCEADRVNETCKLPLEALYDGHNMKDRQLNNTDSCSFKHWCRLKWNNIIMLAQILTDFKLVYVNTYWKCRTFQIKRSEAQK